MNRLSRGATFSLTQDTFGTPKLSWILLNFNPRHRKSHSVLGKGLISYPTLPAVDSIFSQSNLEEHVSAFRVNAMNQHYFTTLNHGFPIDDGSSSNTSSPGSTGSYHHRIGTRDSVMAPPPAWLLCGSNNNSFPTQDDASTTSRIGGSVERASKRLRLASPPRPSMCATRFFNSSFRSTSSSSLDAEAPAMPPSIQRLALPSLLHAGGATSSESSRTSRHHRNCSSESSPCPFGTLM